MTNDAKVNVDILFDILGRQRGLFRQIDKLGRVCIPKGFIDELDRNMNESVEIRLFDGALLLVRNKKERNDRSEPQGEN